MLVNELCAAAIWGGIAGFLVSAFWLLYELAALLYTPGEDAAAHKGLRTVWVWLVMPGCVALGALVSFIQVAFKDAL